MPFGKPHANPDVADHHAGDMPMLAADASGNGDGSMSYSTPSTIGGAGDIVGRAAIVRKDAGRLHDPPPRGNSGARVACGVIRRDVKREAAREPRRVSTAAASVLERAAVRRGAGLRHRLRRSSLARARPARSCARSCGSFARACGRRRSRRRRSTLPAGSIDEHVRRGLGAVLRAPCARGRRSAPPSAPRPARRIHALICAAVLYSRCDWLVELIDSQTTSFAAPTSFCSPCMLPLR